MPEASILVETLDASGKPIAQEIDYVDTEVPLFQRALLRGAPEDAGRLVPRHHLLGRLDPVGGI